MIKSTLKKICLKHTNPTFYPSTWLCFNDIGRIHPDIQTQNQSNADSLHLTKKKIEVNAHVNTLRDETQFRRIFTLSFVLHVCVIQLIPSIGSECLFSAKARGKSLSVISCLSSDSSPFCSLSFIFIALTLAYTIDRVSRVSVVHAVFTYDGILVKKIK